MTKLHGLGEEQITMTEFFMAMIPPTATAQEHKVAVRNGKPIFYDPPDVEAAKEKLTANLARHRPPEKYICGIRLITKWLFPNDGKHRDGEYKIASLTQTTCRRCSRTA